jgi:pimeloyl-ACP methyl ester carboxylesterase
MDTRSPIVFVGGLYTFPFRYRRFVRLLEEVSGRRVFVASINPLDWLWGRLSGYGQLIFEVATAVDRALIASEADRAILVGHSAGGVAARVYLGGDPPYGGRRYSGHRRVSHLITLGSPHEVETRRSTNAILEVNGLFPGALHAGKIEYVSVAGTAVHGADSWLARKSYERLVEDGRVPGDGVVPVRCAVLPGSRKVVLDGVRHAPVSRGRWYGQDRETILRWWPESLLAGGGEA